MQDLSYQEMLQYMPDLSNWTKFSDIVFDKYTTVEMLWKYAITEYKTLNRKHILQRIFQRIHNLQKKAGVYVFDFPLPEDPSAYAPFLRSLNTVRALVQAEENNIQILRDLWALEFNACTPRLHVVTYLQAQLHKYEKQQLASKLEAICGKLNKGGEDAGGEDAGGEDAGGEDADKEG